MILRWVNKAVQETVAFPVLYRSRGAPSLDNSAIPWREFRDFEEFILKDLPPRTHACRCKRRSDPWIKPGHARIKPRGQARRLGRRSQQNRDFADTVMIAGRRVPAPVKSSGAVT